MARNKKPLEIPEELGDLTLIFDGMNIAYSAYYAHNKLSYKGKSTSMIFGVPNIIRSYIQDYKPKKVYVVWDGDRHPKRLELCPEYKSHREKRRDPLERKRFLRQIRRVQKGLYYLGISQLRNEAVEGDDMIYKLVKRQPKDSRIYIVSGDKDFDQLLCRRIQRVNPRMNSKYGAPMHYSLAHIEYPVKHYSQILDSLILLGDKSDDIPGYRGIGPAKCRQFLEKYPSIKEFLDNPKTSFQGIEKDKLREIYKRNKIMMDLALFDRKYNQDQPIQFIRNKQFPHFNLEKWRMFCIKYNLRTFQTNQFLNVFSS